MKFVTFSQVLLNPPDMPTTLTKAKALFKSTSALGIVGKIGTVSLLAHCLGLSTGPQVGKWQGLLERVELE